MDTYPTSVHTSVGVRYEYPIPHHLIEEAS